MTMSETEEPYYPPGPALLYVPSPVTGLVQDPEEARYAFRVDSSVIQEGGLLSVEDVYRERKILRALLEHALWLLDRAEA
jgi:hypothetical protein